MRRSVLAFAFFVAGGLVCSFSACLIDIADLAPRDGSIEGSSDGASDARDEPIPCGAGDFVSLPHPNGPPIGAIASDHVRVFWTGKQSITYFDRAGDAAVGPLFPGFTGVQSIVADGTGIAYVADYGASEGGAGGAVWIFSDGGASVVAAAPTVVDVAVDAKNVYWITEGGRAFAIARTGGSASPIGQLVDAGAATSITVDNGAVFGSFNQKNNCPTATGVVAFSDGGVCTVVKSALVLRVIAKGGVLYFVNYNRCALPAIYDKVGEACSSTPQGIVDDGHDIAVDEKALYRVSAEGIGWVCHSGGTGTMVFDGGTSGSTTLAVDDDYVYITQQNQVFRAPKPCCP